MESMKRAWRAGRRGGAAKRRAFAYGLPVAAILAAIALRLAAPGFADRLSDFCFDAFQRMAPRPAADLPVHVVDIDEASLAEYGQWPWPRTLVAELVRDLSEAGARVIGFDVLFAEPDRSSPRVFLKTIERGGVVPEETRSFLARAPDNDSILAAAVGAAPVVVGEVLTVERGPVPPAKAAFAVAGTTSLGTVPANAGAIAPLDSILKSAAGLGFLNHEPDWDRVVRRVPLLLRAGDKLHPSFAAELLRVASGAKGYVVKTAGANGETNFGRADGIVAVRIGRATIPTDATGSVWLHYTSPAAATRRISAKDVLDGNFDQSRVRGSIIIVGSTFAGNNDLVATPLSAAMGGVEVHAQLIEQVIQGWFLERPDWSTGIELAFAAAVGLALIVIIPHLGALAGAFIALATLVAAGTGSFLAFREAHLLIDAVYPGLVILGVYVVATLIGFLRTEAERRQVRGAFSRYMSPVLVEELAKNPGRLVLGGEMRTMTLMFCDIRGFTTISEGLNAQELTHFINRFLSPMT
ncbi:MAG TPA: CHASE2 domain-containing protein, partial [Stellaceae bacterium]